MASKSPRKSSRIASLQPPKGVADGKDVADNKDAADGKDVVDGKEVAHDKDVAYDADTADDETKEGILHNFFEFVINNDETHEPPKIKRGRPKKDASKSVAPKSVAPKSVAEDDYDLPGCTNDDDNDDEEQIKEAPKIKRGRPKKDATTSVASKPVAPKSVVPKKIVPVSTKTTTENGLLSSSFKSLENNLELLQNVIASTSDASISYERVKSFKTKFDSLFASTDDSTIPVVKKKRGRPPKEKTLDVIQKKPRGRPPKNKKV